MKIKLNKRERMEILLEALRQSVFFRMQLAEQFADGDINFEIIRNDPTFDAGLRIARMYIKDERLLNWWLNESMREGYPDSEGDLVLLNNASELIDYYKYGVRF